MGLIWGNYLYTNFIKSVSAPLMCVSKVIVGSESVLEYESLSLVCLREWYPIMQRRRHEMSLRYFPLWGAVGSIRATSPVEHAQALNNPVTTNNGM